MVKPQMAVNRSDLKEENKNLQPTNVEGGKANSIFILEKGATLKNVVLGAKSIEHVRWEGDGCTVGNVWWEDVYEDTLTFENIFQQC